MANEDVNLTITVTPKIRNKIDRSLEYLEVLYELNKYSNGPEWEEMKPRVEKYLALLFEEDTDVSSV